MKKSFIILPVMCGLIWLFTQFDFSTSQPGCAFCRKEILERQVFYRGEKVLALVSYKPVVPGHVLVIPKRHVERFEQLEGDEIGEIGETLKKVDFLVKKIFSTTGSDLLEKNGREAGQTVPHLHFHYLPRSKVQGEVAFLFRFFLTSKLKPLPEEEIKKLVERYSSVWKELFVTDVF
jgi:histidine triad (HIT) family protein